MTETIDFNKSQYQANFQQYLDSNINGEIGGGNPQQRVELFKRFVPAGRAVLEIGSGGGQDALALQGAGYDVTASEFVGGFLNILNKKGLKTLELDAKKDDLPLTDAIYANAVFVHFSPNELKDFLTRAKQKLQKEKVIFMSVIKGEGYERAARNRGFERDFYYYNLESLAPILENEGFRIAYSDGNDPKWLQVVASINQETI